MDGASPALQVLGPPRRANQSDSISCDLRRTGRGPAKSNRRFDQRSSLGVLSAPDRGPEPVPARSWAERRIRPCRSEEQRPLIGTRIGLSGPQPRQRRSHTALIAGPWIAAVTWRTSDRVSGERVYRCSERRGGFIHTAASSGTSSATGSRESEPSQGWRRIGPPHPFRRREVSAVRGGEAPPRFPARAPENPGQSPPSAAMSDVARVTKSERRRCVPIQIPRTIRSSCGEGSGRHDKSKYLSS